MFRTSLVVLVALVCAQAMPHKTRFGGPHFHFPPSQASGESSSAITKGESTSPLGGSSTIVQQQAGTGGNAAGGGFNFGQASGSTGSSNGLFGSTSQSQTNAVSQQGSNSPLGGFPALPGFPGLGGGSATGTALSQLTQGKTTGPDGSQTVITQLGSSAGGSTQGGATSVNTASGSTSSVDTGLGSQTTSNVDSQSVQTSGR